MKGPWVQGGSFTKKKSRTFFGYKSHTITDDNDTVPVIRSCSVTTAKDHDTGGGLPKRGIIVHRGRGYFGHYPRDTAGTMDGSVRNHELSVGSVRRNIRRSQKRSPIGYPYAFTKRVFHSSHVTVTLVRRVWVK